MRIAVAVHGSPYSSEAAKSALRFVKAAAAQDHEIYRVFFYHDAVLLACGAGNRSLQEDWQAFADQHGSELAVCVSAAERRSLGTSVHDGGVAATAPHFELVGLGQLIDAAISADRLVTFSA